MLLVSVVRGDVRVGQGGRGEEAGGEEDEEQEEQLPHLPTAHRGFGQTQATTRLCSLKKRGVQGC